MMRWSRVVQVSVTARNMQRFCIALHVLSAVPCCHGWLLIVRVVLVVCCMWRMLCCYGAACTGHLDAMRRTLAPVPALH